MGIPLHDLVPTLAAPTCVLSAHDGDIRDGVGGAVHADLRVLSRCEMRVQGARPTLLAHRDRSTEARFISVLSTSGHVDAKVRLDRTRRVSPGRIEEEIWVTTAKAEPTTVEVTMVLESDLAPVTAMRKQTSIEPGLVPQIKGHTAHWGDERMACALSAHGATVEGERTLRVTWTPSVCRGNGVRLVWALELTDRAATVVAAETPGIDVGKSADLMLAPHAPARVRAWLTRSLEDLNALRMTLPGQEHDAFFAAGAPWFFTLFGRDSLWAARMLVELDPSHAASTLRILAGLQATSTDPASAAEPGKIMHELRREVLDLGERSIPPLYYGTIDATALWVCLLHDAWRAGLAESEVRPLLPALRAAMSWITGGADADGDGFAEYADSGRGLVNQCWKDSADAVRFADGRLAHGPIASCEVQGYAYEAALGAADLCEAFGADAGDYRVWAADLRTRFRARFWCGDGDRRYPALALDGNKQRVDSTTSNIGHLLGTGLLDEDEEALVVDRLLRPDMFSGYGLRTMSSDDNGYWPLSYHCGSVWPHDTTITIRGMMRSGHREAAAKLAWGLLAAAEHWNFRLPELFAGEPEMLAYPTACRPQAWSAAAAVVAVQALAVEGYSPVG